MTEELHLKYRPETFDEFIGLDDVINSVKHLIDNDRSHTFLLSGPAGNGKTSLARAIADYVDAESNNIIEVDAASNGSVENLRDLFRSAQYRGFGKNSIRVIVIDEVHSISKTAWQSVLKPLEEPSKDTYYILCTSEPQKVPKAVKTRCSAYSLKEVSNDDLYELLDIVRDAEGFELDDSIIRLCVKEAYGSPRQALVNLATVIEVETKEHAARLLDSVNESDDAVIKLCRELIRGNRNWITYQKLIKALEDKEPESIRLTIVNYISKVLSKETNIDKVGYLIELLDVFSEPYRKQDRMAQLYVNIGQVIFND